jgi:hypothetical protein
VVTLLHFAPVSIQYSNTGHDKLNPNNENSLVINMDAENNPKMTLKPAANT